MLVTLVRDSFLRCFCHTCAVNSALPGGFVYEKPYAQKTKPKCKQPKPNYTTEIRAEEKSRGGMSYEVILSPSRGGSEGPPSPTTPTSPRALTHEDIEHKLEQATLRRKSLEASRLAGVAERLQRLAEAAKKRQERDAAFVAATKAAAEARLDQSADNRKAYLDDLKAKIAEHLSGVEAVRSSTDAQTQKLRDEILEKLSTAEENRNEHINAMIAKLQEHENCVQRVRSEHTAAIKDLESRIQAKLDQAEEKRQIMLSQKLETLKRNLNKIELVHAAAAQQLEEKCEKTKESIAKADQVERPLKTPAIKVDEKIEKAKMNKIQNFEAKIKWTEEKIAQKNAQIDKLKAEAAEKHQKFKQEQERRAQQVRENKKSIEEASS